MKSIKIHRGERMFRRRSPLPRILAGVLAAVLLIAGGYFGARLVADQLHRQPAVTSSDPEQPSEPVSEDSRPEESEPESSAESVPPTPDTDRAPAIVMLDTAVLRDTAALDEALAAAQNAGADTVAFTFKDADGVLGYAFTAERAILAKAVAEDAITSTQLAEGLSRIHAAGLRAAVKLYAFMDKSAPYDLPDARIRFAGEPQTVWLDNALNKGGRPWLNPYADEAHAYLTDLIAELVAGGGVDYLMLDGVRFPASVAYADFGADNAALSRAEVLTLFVKRAKQAAGAVPVMLCADNAAVLGNDTKVYGDNPLTFGADMVAVDLRPEALGNRLTLGADIIEQPNADPVQTLRQVLAFIHLRVQVLDAPVPTVLAHIGTADVITAVRESGAGWVLDV